MAQWGGRTQIQQVAIVLVFLILAFIILFLRLYTRVIVTRNYGPEDWFIVAAFCASITQAALVLAGMHIQPHLGAKLILTFLTEIHYGQGQPESTLSAENLLNLHKTLYIAIPVYLAGLTLTKISILLQYMRLFQEKTIHRIIIGMIVFVAAFGTWSIIGSLLICYPVHYFWDRKGDAKCMNFEAKWFSDAAVCIITDLILLSLPMPYLKGLNLPYRQKAGLIGVFALGGVVCLVSIARLGPLYIIATTNDVSLHNGPAAFLSSMEVNVAIICASLPSLRAITLRTCSRRTSQRHQPTSIHHSHSGWWQFDRRNDDVGLEGGQRHDSGSAITKSVTIEMSTRERRESRKSSVWSLPFIGGIFDGGVNVKAHIKSSIR
ncbi:hypothetical protein E4T52_01887 [Aureobasidium sp. EXF-3400]|nr:hypothetical protein E4T51_05841 [Aureobasidium sp. EXF-12344]KAI4783216.1 hypothetical protein E4T52_01887 [Aureobasidium sp. EXF-3400]